MSTKKHKGTASLYQYVFHSRSVSFAVFVLYAVLFLQPLAPLFANEPTSTTEPTSPPLTEAPAEPLDDEPASSDTTEPSPDEPLADPEVETVSTDDVSDTEPEEGAEVALKSAGATTSAEESPSAADPDDEAEAGLEAEESETDGVVKTSEEGSLEHPVYAVSYSDSNFYQFSKTACVPVAGGSYYCSDSAAPSTETAADELFASPDADGDLEIYLRKDGELTQLTHNNDDDAAPKYDPVSKSVVWHRLINDRYQIMAYDFETGDETILTDSPANNMEPERNGRYTVWQRWVNDNWEIMLHDGRRTVQLTSSVEHDIAPQVQGEMVLWKTVRDRSHIAQVYDIESGVTTAIEGEDADTTLSNPRLVLVYDATTKSGAMQTKGYDPLTGKLVPLAALPPEPLPELPPSDQTGETRALIQGKTQVKEGEEALDEGGTAAPLFPSVDNTATGTATSTPTDDATLVIPAASSTAGESAAAEPELPEIEPLVIGSLEPANVADDTPAIPNLVIPPYTASST